MPRDGSTLIHRYVLWFVITAIDPAQWIKSLLYKLGDLSLYLWSPHKNRRGILHFYIQDFYGGMDDKRTPGQSQTVQSR